MKRLLVLSLIAAAVPCCPDGYGLAGDNATARARVALALAAVQAKPAKNLDCPCGATCTCTAGECGSPNCPSLRAKKTAEAPGPIEWLAYKLAYSTAVREHKPLLIWVGETCPACEAEWGEYVHARLSEYDGDTTIYRGPGVIIGRPDGMGGMDKIGTLSGIPTKDAVKTLLAPVPKNPYDDNPHWPYRSVPQAFLPMMPPPMPMMPMGGFGGFGGGFGGGGGGGC